MRNEEKIKLDFNLGDMVYYIDDNCRWFETEVYRIELCEDGTIEYTTPVIDFDTYDIGKWVFKTEEDREKSQYRVK